MEKGSFNEKFVKINLLFPFNPILLSIYLLSLLSSLCNDYNKWMHQVQILLLSEVDESVNHNKIQWHLKHPVGNQWKSNISGGLIWTKLYIPTGKFKIKKILNRKPDVTCTTSKFEYINCSLNLCFVLFYWE